jgi:hypothetical protein
MNNKQKLLTATAITGTIVSASAFTVFDYAICRRKKQPDVRKKEKWKRDCFKFCVNTKN